MSVRGSGIFGNREDLLRIAGLLSSAPFDFFVKCMLGRFAHPQFDNGAISKTPVPKGFPRSASAFEIPVQRSFLLKRSLHTTDELSHSFLLPNLLRDRIGEFDPEGYERELSHLQRKIDDIAFKLYGFDKSDSAAITEPLTGEAGLDPEDSSEDIEDRDLDVKSDDHLDQHNMLLSWCVGVAFGRFDWHLATGEHDAPPEPGPFDPLPARSPGMLPEEAPPFHAHPGILVEGFGDPHDLSRLIEDVLATVNHPAPDNVRRWLRRDFFSYHLKNFSKSHRKAPIYWPLSTTSGNYTLWLYYPALTDQTLYTAANDFVAPKLEETSRLANALRSRADRSPEEERQLEQLQDPEVELKELQDELLRLAPTWKPNHDDGVQITAAPLWRLFRHRPWQKVLRETWAKLEKGDFDWSHLAMSYWPERVREKCKTDKSLAIAHDLEDLYVEPVAKSAKPRRKKSA